MKRLLQNVLSAGCGLWLVACGGSVATPGMPRMERSSATYDAVVTLVLDAGPYTYVRVRAPEGALHWVVTLRREVRVDAPVTVRVLGTRDTFCSARLNRCFDGLEFATLGVREGT